MSFDLNDPSKTSVKKGSPEERMFLTGPSGDEEIAGNALDSEDAIERHNRLMSYYRQELDRQAENRFNQAVEEDYYDNIQWTEEDAAILRERGQAPLVYNVIAQSVNWIIGSEKRGRTDFKILPREKEDTKPAEHKTKLLKYLSDVNRLPFHRSRAFEDTVKVGIGWLEDGATDDDDGEVLYSRYESWRNMLWDSSSTELDFSDARYVFRSKWMDMDIARAFFPDRADIIARSASEPSSFGIGMTSEDGDDAMDFAEFEREDHGIGRVTFTNTRQRVRMIECWYRTPEKVEKLRGGPLAGEEFDSKDPAHVEAVRAGESVIASRMMMRTRVAIMASAGLLYDGPSPYKHNRFPFTPIWGFRRGRDGMPYGVIRWMRDIQDDINKRASKALYILSTNKTIMDEGAVDDMERFEEEVSRPDGIIIKKQGKELLLNVDRDLAPAHLDLMSRNIQMVQQVGGVTDELLGRSTNAVSGVAIQARQEQGSVATNKLFDNLRLAVQMQGELQLSLTEQFFTEQKQFRVTNQRGTPEYVTINDGLPENDITRAKADFIISEGDWRATMRQAAAEQLMQMMMKMPPQVSILMLDLVVDSMDLPNRDELVKRIRQVNGQRDPDATEPTPEEMQAQQAQAMQAEAQQRMFMAELASKEADAKKKSAEAERIARQTIGTNVTAARDAMEAAKAVVQMPTVAAVADNILQESGWQTNVEAAAPAAPPPQQTTPQPDIMPAANGMVQNQTQPQQPQM